MLGAGLLAIVLAAVTGGPAASAGGPSPVDAPGKNSQEATPAMALEAGRLYAPLGARVMVRVAGWREQGPGRASIVLYWGEGSAVVAQAPLTAEGADLSGVFPQIWEQSPPQTLYAQLEVQGEPSGPPLIIEPLVTRPAFVDGWSAQVLLAFERGDEAALRALRSLPSGARDEVRGAIEARGGGRATLCGVRVWADRQVILETSAGRMVLSLRTDAAPATCHRFVSLVEGGFYDGLTFHRVVAEDARGDPYLVQAGDPLGSGAGGAGERLEYEPSTLEHDFGVVSMARAPGDPNSASSQFFICLSRRACAGLDGRYAAFAQVVSGAPVLRAIAGGALVASRPDDPRSPIDRPLDPVTIERAFTRPAGPILKPAQRREGAGLPPSPPDAP